jgi:hypothetical protein
MKKIASQAPRWFKPRTIAVKDLPVRTYADSKMLVDLIRERMRTMQEAAKQSHRENIGSLAVPAFYVKQTKPEFDDDVRCAKYSDGMSRVASSRSICSLSTRSSCLQNVTASRKVWRIAFIRT